MVKNIILDCDPGMDDSMAIVLALKSPELKVLAITTVCGNYPVDVTSKNARKMLELIGRTDIPVARGMEQPMVRQRPSDPFTHGKDGQAENFLPEPTMPLSEKHAVQLIIDTVKAHAGNVTIVATGPLTNIAMALRLAPEITSQINEIVAISGAFGLNKYAFLNATGDTPQSEWNVYVDPEAAKIVYESGVPFTAIGLDVATYFNVDFSDDDLAEFKASPRKEAHFLAKAVDFVHGRGFGAYCSCIDCMAVAYAIKPSLVKTEKARVGVVTSDGLCLGMTVRDGRHHHVWQQLPEINIAVDADYQGFLTLLKDTVLR